MIIQEELNPAQPRDLSDRTPPPSFFFRDTEQAAQLRLGFMLKAVSTTLAIAYFLEAAYLSWKPNANEILYQCAMINAVAFFTLRLILARVQLPARWTHGAATLAAALAIAYSALESRLTAVPWATSHMMMVLLVIGFIFVSRGWYAFLTLLTVGAWFWGAWPFLWQETWLHMGVTLMATITWSGGFMEMRIRTMAEWERKLATEDFHETVQKHEEHTQHFKKPNRWCSVCKASENAVIRHDGQKIIDANPAAARMLGMDREAMASQPINLVLAPEKREGLHEQLRLGSFQAHETVAFRKDGTRVPVELLSGVTSDGEGAPRVLVLRDLGERQRANARWNESNRRNQSLARRQAELAILALTADQPANLDPLLNQIASIAQRWLPASLGAFVVIWDNQRGAFAVAGCSAQGALDTEKLVAGSGEDSIVGWMTQNQDSLVVQEVRDDAFGVRPLYPSESVEAFAALPLASADGVFGFLLALENKPREFPAADLEFLQILAYRAASACTHSSLVEQLQYLSTPRS